jgi:Peptidase_C39 like family
MRRQAQPAAVASVSLPLRRSGTRLPCSRVLIVAMSRIRAAHHARLARTVSSVGSTVEGSVMTSGGVSRRRLLAFTALLAPSIARCGQAAAASAPRVTIGDAQNYTAYIPVALKKGQFAPYTCEFDAAWIILKTFGVDTTLAEQVALVGIDTRVDPHLEDTSDGAVVQGGDITRAYSGDYTQSYLARTTGQAMRKVFVHFGLTTTLLAARDEVEAALDAGAPIWMKTTVDFGDWRPITWVTPEGKALPGVLGNDHAVVAIGYNDEVVVIRDALGPTNTNWDRTYEYEVPWDTFLAVSAAQGFDALAVSPQAPAPRQIVPQGSAPSQSGTAAVGLEPVTVTGST